MTIQTILSALTSLNTPVRYNVQTHFNSDMLCCTIPKNDDKTLETPREQRYPEKNEDERRTERTRTKAALSWYLAETVAPSEVRDPRWEYFWNILHKPWWWQHIGDNSEICTPSDVQQQWWTTRRNKHLKMYTGDHLHHDDYSFVQCIQCNKLSTVCSK